MQTIPHPTLSGPLDVPATAPKSTSFGLILLHGFGDQGSSWLNLMLLLRASLPAPLNTQLALFAPNGPAPAPTSTPQTPGYQWFRDNNWTFRDPPGLAATADALLAYLEHVSTSYHIPYANLALLGFSQGAMTTLYTVPRLSQPIAGHIAIAGLLTAPLAPPLHPAIAQQIPTLMLHGTEDDVVPADQSVKSAAAYHAHSLPAEVTLVPAMAHGLSPAGMAHLSLFLQQIFPT